MTETVSGRVLHARVVETLRGRIISGELAPGTELRQEKLAAEMGVSRTPVREALQLLAQEGLLTLRPHRGALVNGLDPASLRDYYDLLGLLEGEAYARACHSTFGRGQLESVRRIARDFAASGANVDYERQTRLAVELNELVFANCGNLRLAALIRENIAYDLSLPEGASDLRFRQTFYEQFCRMLQDWLDGNEEEVRRRMRWLNSFLCENYMLRAARAPDGAAAPKP